MRITTLALTIVGGLALALVLALQLGGGGTAATAPEHAPSATPHPTMEPDPEPEAEPHRVVIPGLAADWIPPPCSANVPDPCPLPRTELTVTSADGARALTLAVEIANRPDQRARGLMFRESMDERAGMLFVFAGEQWGGFWMRNTLIPLDIAYLDADGTVLQIVQGTPLSEDVLWADQGYWYTLEVNGGWFERHGLGVGDAVAIPAGLEARD